MLQHLNLTSSLLTFLLAEQLPDLLELLYLKSVAVSFKRRCVNSAHKDEALVPRRQ